MYRQSEVAPAAIVVAVLVVLAISVVATAGVIFVAGQVLGLGLGFNMALLASLAMTGAALVIGGVTRAISEESSFLGGVLGVATAIAVLKVVLGISWGAATLMWLIAIGMLLLVGVALGFLQGLAGTARPSTNPYWQRERQDWTPGSPFNVRGTSDDDVALEPSRKGSSWPY